MMPINRTILTAAICSVLLAVSAGWWLAQNARPSVVVQRLPVLDAAPIAETPARTQYVEYTLYNLSGTPAELQANAFQGEEPRQGACYAYQIFEIREMATYAPEGQRRIRLAFREVPCLTADGGLIVHGPIRVEVTGETP